MTALPFCVELCYTKQQEFKNCFPVCVRRRRHGGKCVMRRYIQICATVEIEEEIA